MARKADVLGQKWDYPESGGRWDIQQGDVWEVGPHLFLCGDLFTDAAVAWGQQQAASSSMVFTDPPWGASAMNSYRTKTARAEAAGQSATGASFDGLLARLMPLYAASAGPVLVEMGKRDTPKVKAAAEIAGGRLFAEWDVTYYRTRPCKLLGFTFHEDKTWTQRGGIEGQDDMVLPSLCIAEFTDPGAVVFDPCMGRGLTATSADALGRSSVGIEMHPRRLAVTVDKLASRHKPVKVGTIEGVSGSYE